MSPEKIVVTGGAGFIGSVLCRALLRQGHEVLAFDNLSFGRWELLGGARESVRCVEGDLRDAAALRRALEEFRPTEVYHLGAIHFIPYCNAHPVEAVEVNVNGTRNLLDACRAVQPRLVLLASTAAVYPILGSPFSEACAPGPLDIYGHTKLVGEDLARLFHRETGTRTLVARFFNAFGPDDTNPHLVPDIHGQLRAGETVVQLGNLDPVRDYIHVEDMASAVLALRAAPHEPFDVFNLGSGEGVSVREVVEAFSRALERPIEIRQAAERIRKVERAELVSDIGKLRRVAGWQPTWNFARGIRELVLASGGAPRAQGG